MDNRVPQSDCPFVFACSVPKKEIVLLSVLHMIDMSLGYILMLLVMSFNIFIVIAVVIGAGLAHFILRPIMLRKVAKKMQRRQRILRIMTPPKISFRETNGVEECVGCGEGEDGKMEERSMQRNSGGRGDGESGEVGVGRRVRGEMGVMVDRGMATTNNRERFSQAGGDMEGGCCQGEAEESVWTAEGLTGEGKCCGGNEEEVEGLLAEVEVRRRGEAKDGGKREVGQADFVDDPCCGLDAEQKPSLTNGKETPV
jgi:hypothetical protein